MTGPCLCGDPYCGRCGNPGLAEAEAAEEAIMEEVAKAARVGVRYDTMQAVIVALREGAERERKEAEDARLQNEAEARAAKEESEYWANAAQPE
jgi:hypothetical protein